MDVEAANLPEPTPVPTSDRRDWATIPVLLLALLILVLRIIPEFRPGLLGAFCWMMGMQLPQLLAALILLVSLIVAIFRRPYWTRRRARRWGILLLLLFSGMTFRRYPSSFDDKPSTVPFRLPLDGPITVGWGGNTPDVNYHVIAPSQSWAYDLLVTRGGSTHSGDGKALTDYYIYDQPVLAAAGGEVVSATEGDPDMPPGELGGGKSPTGNHVVIKVAPGEYLYTCHLKPGSLLVRKGQRVEAGAPLGRAGNSGNTSEPHVHIHLQSTANLIMGEGIPLPFHNYKTADGRVVASGVPRGGVSASGTFGGETVENIPPVIETVPAPTDLDADATRPTNPAP